MLIHLYMTLVQCCTTINLDYASVLLAGLHTKKERNKCIDFELTHDIDLSQHWSGR